MEYIGHLDATISATGNLSFNINTDFNAKYSYSIAIPKVVSKVYVKQNGAWVEQSDLTTVF